MKPLFNPKTARDAAARYTFHLTLTQGSEHPRAVIEWHGLTLTQARNMHSYTDKHMPSNVVAFGWEEER